MPLDMTPNSISSRGISWYGGTQLRSCLVPVVVDDAGLHQIGDPVADRPRMAATLPVRPRARGERGTGVAAAPLETEHRSQGPAHNRPGGFPREKHFPSGNACANHYDLGRLYFESV